MSNRTRLAVPSVLAVVAVSATAVPARALSCAAPAGGAAAGSDILVTCTYCDVDAPAVSQVHNYDPSSGDLSGSYAVEEVERAALVDGGISVRYRAAEALPEGDYVIEPGGSQVNFATVPELGPPQIPMVRLVGYQMQEGGWGPTRTALFELEGVNGVLVADVGEPDDDPMTNAEHAWRSADAAPFTFSLGVDLCYASFPDADYGLQTRVRFGTLNPNGDFSGWTEWVGVRYPESAGQYEVEEDGDLFRVNAETGERTLIPEPMEDAPTVDGPVPDEPSPNPEQEPEPAPVAEPVGDDPDEPEPTDTAEPSADPKPADDASDQNDDDPRIDEGVARNPVDESARSSAGCALTGSQQPFAGTVSALFLGLVALGRGRRRRR